MPRVYPPPMMAMIKPPPKFGEILATFWQQIWCRHEFREVTNEKWYRFKRCTSCRKERDVV